MLPIIDFEKLRTFYISAKWGKFSMAAQELGIDNSAVTRQIQTLEKELNCALFERGGFRGLKLTEKGKILHKFAYELFSKVAEIQPALNHADDHLDGTLKICVHGGYSLDFIHFCIDEFIERYPQIKLEIPTSRGVLDVSTREADISILPSMGIPGDFIEKRLFSFRVKLYASKKYLDKYGYPKTPEDLKHHRFISALSPSFASVNWYLKLIPGIQIEPYFTSDSPKLIQKLIQKGIGIASLSPQFVDKNDKSLIEVLPTISGPEINISMIYGEHYKNSKKVEVFYQFLLEKVKEFVVI